jgi:hypothetical protein
MPDHVVWIGALFRLALVNVAAMIDVEPLLSWSPTSVITLAATMIPREVGVYALRGCCTAC